MSGKMNKISCPHCWNRLFEGDYIGVCCLRCCKCKSTWKFDVDGHRIKIEPLDRLDRLESEITLPE